MGIGNHDLRRDPEKPSYFCLESFEDVAIYSATNTGRDTAIFMENPENPPATPDPDPDI